MGINFAVFLTRAVLFTSTAVISWVSLQVSFQYKKLVIQIPYCILLLRQNHLAQTNQRELGSHNMYNVKFLGFSVCVFFVMISIW